MKIRLVKQKTSHTCKSSPAEELNILKKRAIQSIENVFVYSDRSGNSDLQSD